MDNQSVDNLPSQSTPDTTRTRIRRNNNNLDSPQASTSRSITVLRPRILHLSNQSMEISDEDSDNELSIVEEIRNDQVILPSLAGDATTTIINISRSSCFRELINIYDNNEIMNTRLNIHFVGEIGIDGGGLTKEIFNIFFEQCGNIYFLGDDCLVPYLPLNKRMEINNVVPMMIAPD
ncbi:uncharacterized protein LOC123298361 [Chrysoperla carnea]|uniref:uncharacterized protein LOC123298361 n=1 Tax=Chrysoperla carnea TaxID=189513 RepID=UPI001D080667|nr:uncharacterized protein LOC123298361 [Chrysoperla carnea]